MKQERDYTTSEFDEIFNDLEIEDPEMVDEK